MNIYTITFYGEGRHITETAVKARNKVDALNKAMDRLRDWRRKDRIDDIKIVSDAGNRELDHTDYQ